MFRKPCLLALAISSALACAPPLLAQPSQAGRVELSAIATSGVVFGSVRESVRGVALPGAQITIDGRSAVSDSDGTFRIAGLQPGTYTLSVDFLGYKPIQQQIRLEPGQGLRAEVVLVSTIADAAQLDRIEVRATRDAQALALNQQRASVNYRNVVSADLLGRFPDANVAEATQRIPGVSIERDQGEGRYVNVRGAPLEFANVTINGVQLAAPNASRRAIELDTIPSDVIATLEVTKALTPDMDGDAIAGSINIVTQSALDREGNVLRGSIGSGRYELGPGNNDRGNVTWSNRFGADGNLGLLLGASGSRAGRFTQNVETDFFRAPDGRLLPELLEVKDYEGDRRRVGLSARLDNRFNENHLVYAIANYAKFRDNEFRNLVAIELERHSADSTQRQGVAGRATFDRELRERVNEQTIVALNLGGEHFFGEDWRADWQTSFSRGRATTPIRQQMIFRSTLRPPLRYDYADPDFPRFTVLNPDGSVRQQGINLPEDLFQFRRYNQRFELGEERETALRVDLSRPQNWIGRLGEISFGVRARLREKEFDDERQRNSVGPSPVPFSQMLCPRVSNNFGQFEFGRVFCNDIFERFAPPLRNQNLLPLVEASIVSDFTADEDIYAGYFRLDAQWDRLSMIGGLRYERTETSGRAFRFDRITQRATPLEVSRSYVKFLPSLHFRYELEEDTILRWSWSTGLSRPNFSQTVPFININEEAREIDLGNPVLKATYSNNFDISIEHYIRPLGLVSAALFYKDLTDPIFRTNRRVTEPGELFGFNATQRVNGDSGWLRGLELAWQQTFDWLPSPWDGFGVYANYTYTESEGELPFGLGKTELPGSSRNNVNFAVFYEKSGFNTRLAWNYRSPFIQEFDLLDDELDVYWDRRGVLDLTASYQLNANWQLFGEFNNLTDSKQRRFQGERSRVLELEQFGRFWLLGARFEY